MDPQSAGDPQSTYDRIAAHFSKTREYAWPEVESFLDGRTATRGLDIGCGNGRHTELLAERADAVVGVDLSRELLREAVARARERGYDGTASFVHGDAATLPIATDAVGVAVYVATLHHLPSREARVRSLDELARVLAPGGTALVSAWSTAHDRFDREEGFDTTVDWTLPGGETVPRYYHIYSPAEFEIDLGESALSVVDVDISSGNCYATVTASDA
ncbi:class I SAM-dependent methyltransferase [Halorubrum lacusprofundi]|jgi:SAM-dependent methyltransferase|uniref:Methyltransferase type 11 n=1 Tax=Halorubrum lacusprofundi (strain ATCC 49239 / DSM 5036 / JCM 8891 / ACAM 34) TaxID=416348 RepID=B9LMN9_HALLT|nr:class I SAM-dependent methyltransferase [Halorubrum lacusprofundi]ACM56627.1 Methyltransferase type 11 [Halorubrum lacusprofundi ATCC 49239]MCG1005108.1 class I SAM-dependent methyltransferase [Halorubrum lacusprofundi]